MNNYIILQIYLVLMLVTPTASFAADKIKIGISTPLTGNAATYGVDLKNTVIFANEKLANNKYELVFEDDRCNGKSAADVAQRFVNILKLRYAAGFACSSTVLSSAKTYDRARVITMVMGGSAPEISNAGDYIFRTWSSDVEAAKKLYEYVSARHKIFGILSEQTDYAQSLTKSFSDNNSAAAIQIVSENFLTDELDFRAILLKFKSQHIDGLFINSQTESTFLAALKQARDLGLNVKIYSVYFAGSPSFLEKAKELANDIVYVDLPSARETASSEGLKLFEEFEQRFGRMKSLEVMFLTAFEGFRALHQAIESGQDLRRYLYSTKFHGIFGDWEFDRNGDIQGLNFILKVVRDGKTARLE